MSNDALDFLLSSGAPGISFKDPAMRGKWVAGTILNMEKIQQTDFQSKKPKFYDEEKTQPMWQIVFTLQTDDRDPEIDNDDGIRSLYAKGQMIGAIRTAIKETGHQGEVVGGKLGIVWYGEGEAKNGLNPPKQYKAKFAPPSATDAVNDVAETEPEADAPVPPPPSEEFSEEPF